MKGITSGYLHYWFSNYKGRDYDSEYNSMKQVLLSQQTSKLKENKMKAISSMKGMSKSTNEAFSLVDVLTSDKGASELQKALEPSLSKATETTISGAAPSGIEGFSFSQVAQRKLLTKVEDLGVFQNSLEKVLEEAVNKLGTKDTYTQLQAIVIANLQSKDKTGMAKSDTRNFIMSEILSKKKGQIFSVPIIEGFGTLNKTIASLMALCYALKDEGGGYSIPSNYDSEVLQIIANKVASNLNNISGLIFEVANARAINQAELKFLDSIEAVYGQSGQKINIEKDPLLEQMYGTINQNLDTTRVHKNDVDLTITKDSVKLSFGVSTKRLKLEGGGLQTVTINSGTPVLAAFAYSGLATNQGFMNYVLNVLGGHRNENHPVPGQSLNQRWDNIVSLLTISNAVRNLSGTGTKGDNALFLVINNNVLSVSQIIEDIVSSGNSGNGKIKLINRAAKGSLSRDAFNKTNQWEGDIRAPDTALALARSGMAKEAIMGTLYSKKLQTQLLFPGGSLMV